jgi:hypothetical protein
MLIGIIFPIITLTKQPPKIGRTGAARRGRAGAPGRTITAQMKAAGAKALFDSGATWPGPADTADDLQTTVTKIYRAMERARRISRLA